MLVKILGKVQMNCYLQSWSISNKTDAQHTQRLIFFKSITRVQEIQNGLRNNKVLHTYYFTMNIDIDVNKCLYMEVLITI